MIDSLPAWEDLSGKESQNDRDHYEQLDDWCSGCRILEECNIVWSEKVYTVLVMLW